MKFIGKAIRNGVYSHRELCVWCSGWVCMVYGNGAYYNRRRCVWLLEYVRMIIGISVYGTMK